MPVLLVLCVATKLPLRCLSLCVARSPQQWELRPTLGQDDRLAALKRLDDEARRVERRAGPPVEDVIAEERRLSHAYGGRSILGWEPPPEALDGETRPKPGLNRG